MARFDVVELTYKDPAGKVANELLYRHDEPRFEIVQVARPWCFDGDGALYRLVAEANRIRFAHLFDPVLAVHTSLVDPLPHQITAVYEAMLPRQPLRFLLADDSGAGGEGVAAALVSKLGSHAETAREWAYRLYTLYERKKRTAEALAYNGLVQSFPELVRLAQQSPKPKAGQGDLFGGEEG